MSPLITGVFRRDMAIAFRQKSELVQPMVFLLMVVTLFPLGVGPSPDVLQRIGPGVIWIAAILSSLMGMERLFRDDFQDGSLEQLILSPVPLWQVAAVKVAGHWLVSFIPLLVLSPLLAMFLNLTSAMYLALMATLLLGTPLLSFTGAIAVGLTVGLHRGSLLLALLLIPVFIPLLIFATSAVDSAALQLPYHPQLAIIGAMLLMSMAVSPFAIAYALKVSQN
ncbi:heme exporter protein CcmB [Alteromonas sp. CYL-A6]|uniref:heme exporter protein CcmB n=1 Tax=Alteromonas nitratireducens TaxID=3390813 RepID=UPI0034AE791C